MSIASLSYDVTNTNPIGLASLENASKMLADFGRNGDTYVVHAKEGETVIPLEVLDNNPKLKDMLFKQMRELDLDPNRYIIGNELNSINPVTGQPEFFVKKLFKGLKKAVKKLAPIVLPIAAPYLLPTMPLFLSTGIGTLAGGLAGGQRPKDALRNAVIAGGLAGLGSKAFGGQQGFGSGDFSASASDLGLTKDYDIRGIFDQTKGDGTLTGSDKGILETLEDLGSKPKEIYSEYLSPSRKSIMPSTEDIIKSAKETAQSKLDVFKGANLDLTKAEQKELYKEFFKDAYKVAEKELAPSALQKYAPLGSVTALGLYGLDQAGLPIFTVPEEKEKPRMLTGLDLLEQDPDRFKFTNFYGDNPYYTYRAEGGEIVGPGTSTSDSIPAMLSDGEFVMNAKAVKGAGGGDRQQGAKRMYQMMKKFERVA